MPTLTIDQTIIAVPDGATILDAARAAGIAIPTLCFLDKRHAPTSCFVCVVRVNGGERLLPACATPAAEGMIVESETAEVRAARKMALELLLSDHLGDCLGPCQRGCPAHLDIPTMLRQIGGGQLRAAIVTVKAAIPLPATLGRICPNLCERGCRRAQVDDAVSICRLKRYVADADLAAADPYLPACLPASGKRVAIVGAGPAGLSAAWFLQQAGHACTLLDEGDAPGGRLRDGVPEDTLPRAVLDAEIALLARLGAAFRPGTRVEETAIAALRRQYDAVLLARGDAAPPAVDHPGIFTVAPSPRRHAVRAVAGGQAAAVAVMQYLAGEPVTAPARPFTVQIGRLQPEELAQFMAHASPHGRLTPAEGFNADDAVAEAGRCLHCDCRGLADCQLRRYAGEYGAVAARFNSERRRYEEDTTHPALRHEPGKCIACGRCVQLAAEAQEELGLTYIGRGFAVRVAAPFNERIAAGLARVARACIAACPVGALTARETGEP